VAWKPSKRFRKQYARIFKENPVAANMLLLMAELADQKSGQAYFDGDEEAMTRELRDLMVIRFEDVRAWQL
jgi:hypothetical protein